MEDGAAVRVHGVSTRARHDLHRASHLRDLAEYRGRYACRGTIRVLPSPARSINVRFWASFEIAALVDSVHMFYKVLRVFSKFRFLFPLLFCPRFYS